MGRAFSPRVLWGGLDLGRFHPSGQTYARRGPRFALGCDVGAPLALKADPSLSTSLKVRMTILRQPARIPQKPGDAVQVRQAQLVTLCTSYRVHPLRG
jgi:hypothetical protein